MRVVTRVYVDGKTKPYVDEYKTDCIDRFEVDEAVEDLREFLQTNLEELEDEDDAESD